MCMDDVKISGRLFDKCMSGIYEMGEGTVELVGSFICLFPVCVHLVGSLLVNVLKLACECLQKLGAGEQGRTNLL